MRKTFTLLFLLATPITVAAQSYDEGYSHHQLGAEASMLTGIGGSYSYIFDSLFRIKTTLWAYYEDQGGGQTDWTESVGLQLQYTILRTEVSRFYTMIGGFYYSHVNKAPSVYYDVTSSYYSPYSNAEHDYAAGIGVGIELMAWRHIALFLEGSFEYGGTNYTYGARSIYIGPGLGAGVGYRF